MENGKKDKLQKEVKGMALGAVGLFLLIALLSFNAGDPSPNTYSAGAGVHNFGGKLGADVADLFLQIFGVASYAVPVALLYLSYKLLRFKELRWLVHKGIAFLFFLIALSALFAFSRDTTVLFGQQVQTGGLVGSKVGGFLKTWFGVPGALLFLLPLLAVSIMVLSRFSFVLFAGWGVGALRARWSRYLEKRALKRELLGKTKKSGERAAPQIRPVAVTPPTPAPILKKEKLRD
jgi:S-DNA-T family DNA segregation ATPase FtsK/SpoIIIE